MLGRRNGPSPDGRVGGGGGREGDGCVGAGAGQTRVGGGLGVVGAAHREVGRGEAERGDGSQRPEGDLVVACEEGGRRSGGTSEDLEGELSRSVLFALPRRALLGDRISPYVSLSGCVP